METKYLYLLLNLASILPPLVLSFDKKVAYYKRWKSLWPSIIIVGAFFITWDVLFTRLGVWGFNAQYLTGITIINLPLEEWLFFITIPYASVFIYDCMKAYFPFLYYPVTGRRIAIVIAVLLLTISILSINQWYTSLTFLLLSLVLIVLVYIKVEFLGRFFISYLIVLIPFFIINGILTGSGIAEEVVWYDNTKNLSVRLITIPVEDMFYGMLLILGNVAFYEYFQRKSNP